MINERKIDSNYISWNLKRAYWIKEVKTERKKDKIIKCGEVDLKKV